MHRVLVAAEGSQNDEAVLQWAVSVADPGLVLATSATARQVRTQLFKEIRAVRPFGLDLLPRATAVYHHVRHQVIGFSTNKADAFQGHHDARQMLLFDEATGISGGFADRAETMFTGEPGHAWIAGYNPNDPTAWPYAAEQSGGWAVVRLSALDHPNVAAERRGDPPPVPGAVRLRQLRARLARQCEPCDPDDPAGFEFPDGSGRWHRATDPRFDPQVRGRWPGVETDQVWPDAAWQGCLAPVTVLPHWPVQVGCDVARSGGNRTAIAVRKGLALVHLEAHTRWPSSRVGRHIADRLRELCREYAPPGTPAERVPVLVDGTGGYGTPVTDYPDGFDFVPVTASAAAADPARFPNTRSELWWVVREAADEGAVRLGGCTRVGADLVEALRQEWAAARYALDARSRRVVDGKDTLKDRLGRSPDLADAVHLAWYPPR